MGIADGLDRANELGRSTVAELAATPTEIEDASTRPAAWSLDHARSPRLREVAAVEQQIRQHRAAAEIVGRLRQGSAAGPSRRVSAVATRCNIADNVIQPHSHHARRLREGGKG